MAAKLKEFSLGTWLKLFLKKYLNFHRPGDHHDVLVFATPRSGSTFLCELIHSQKGMKMINEPLDIRNPFVRSSLGITDWRDLLPNPGREDKIRDYFSRIQNNKVPFVNQRPFNKNYRFFTNCMVFKIIHGGEDMINWFKKQLNARIVYLIRHPIPVALSRRVHPRLPFFLKNSHYRSFFSSDQVLLAESVIKNGTHFEKGIVEWCLQNSIPLYRSDRRDWFLLTYEELVTNIEVVVKCLAKFFNLPDERKMIESSAIPSRVTYQSDSETRSFFQQEKYKRDQSWLIKKWKDKVNSEQEKIVFNILEKFNIEAYTYGEFMPTKRYLVSHQNRHEHWLC